MTDSTTCLPKTSQGPRSKALSVKPNHPSWAPGPRSTLPLPSFLPQALLRKGQCGLYCPKCPAGQPKSDTVPATRGCQLSWGPSGRLVSVLGPLEPLRTQPTLAPKQPCAALSSPNCSLTGISTGRLLVDGSSSGGVFYLIAFAPQNIKNCIVAHEMPCSKKNDQKCGSSRDIQTHTPEPRNNPANPSLLTSPVQFRTLLQGGLSTALPGRQGRISSVSEIRARDQNHAVSCPKSHS